jgi:hypothetical protein
MGHPKLVAINPLVRLRSQIIGKSLAGKRSAHQLIADLTPTAAAGLSTPQHEPPTLELKPNKPGSGVAFIRSKRALKQDGIGWSCSKCPICRGF